MTVALTKNYEYDLVHCHSPIGSVICRAAFRNDDARMIYTAHGFHFYKGAPKQNWLIYYPIEKFFAQYTDDLITINNEDYERATRENLAKKVHLVNGIGIDTKVFEQIDEENLPLYRELKIPKESIILTSIGELNQNKNHQIVIEALSKIENTNIHYVICGQGPLKQQLKQMANEYGVNLHLLGFRKDIPHILNNTDIFVFPSKREGLPVSLMEAMANGLPAIVSDIRGNRDLIDHGKGGYLFKLKSENILTAQIHQLITQPEKMKSFSDYNKEKIRLYDTKHVNSEMVEIYKNNFM